MAVEIYLLLQIIEVCITSSCTKQNTDKVKQIYFYFYHITI